MDKIKVWLSPYLYDYQQTMTEWVQQARDEKLRFASQVEDDLEPCTGQAELYAPGVPGLLTPPWIESLFPVFYWLEEGGIEGFVNIVTSDLFGITEICLTFRDEAGQLLEQGYAEPDEECLGLWAYPPRLAPALGTTIIVRAVASDGLGGLSIAEEQLTLTEAYLRSTTNSVDQRAQS